MRIVRANAHRRGALIEQLHKQCFVNDRRYRPTHGWWWIAWDRGTPAAFAGMIPSLKWNDALYFVRCGVMEDYRGLGLQKRLIEVRLEKARQLGMNWAVTDTRRNCASANSLIDAGFKLYEPTSPWAFKDSMYWRRKV